MLNKFVASALLLSSLTMAAPAFAATAMPVASTPAQLAIYTCVGTAVTTRETAVASAFTAFSSTETTALATRQSALQVAWGMSTAKTIRTAVMAAWKTYRTAHRAASKMHNAAVKASWQQFAKDRKACKPMKTTPVETPSAADDMTQ